MLSQNKVAYLAGYHETSTACPLVIVWGEEVRRGFGERLEDHGIGPYLKGLIDDC